MIQNEIFKSVIHLILYLCRICPQLRKYKRKYIPTAVGKAGQRGGPERIALSRAVERGTTRMIGLLRSYQITTTTNAACVYSPRGGMFSFGAR